MAPGDIKVADEEFAVVDGRPLVARLYKREPIRPVGGIVLVPGGTWTNANRKLNEGTALTLAGRGWIVATPEFRQPPDVRYPLPVADINLAIRWLKDHVRREGLASEVVGGIGFSSGGHQLMLNALMPMDPQFAMHQGPKQTDASVAFAVLCYAVLDPQARYSMARITGRNMLIERTEMYFPTDQHLAHANPQLIVASDLPIALPPLCIVQGLKDRNIPRNMASDFAEAYRARGGAVELHLYEDAEHGFLVKDPTGFPAQDAMSAITRFLDRRIQASGE